VAYLHKVLGDPVRLRIVNMLLASPSCVKALCAVLDMSQPRVSRHVAVLKAANIIDSRREGKFVFFSLQYEKECEGLFQCIINARKDFELLREDVKRLQNFQKEFC